MDVVMGFLCLDMWERGEETGEGRSTREGCLWAPRITPDPWPNLNMPRTPLISPRSETLLLSVPMPLSLGSVSSLWDSLRGEGVASFRCPGEPGG